MTTIKAYTDIEQSRKLAEILPLESTDMYYFLDPTPAGNIYHLVVQQIAFGVRTRELEYDKGDIPCWSLAALLSVLPKEVEIDGQHYAPCLFPIQDKWLLKLYYNSNHTITSPIAIFSDNPVDACYDVIIKLHELNLL